MIDVDGEIIQIFDPLVHQEVANDGRAQGSRLDQRWVRNSTADDCGGGRVDAGESRV